MGRSRRTLRGGGCGRILRRGAWGAEPRDAEWQRGRWGGVSELLGKLREKLNALVAGIERLEALLNQFGLRRKRFEKGGGRRAKWRGSLSLSSRLRPLLSPSPTEALAGAAPELWSSDIGRGGRGGRSGVRDSREMVSAVRRLRFAPADGASQAPFPAPFLILPSTSSPSFRDPLRPLFVFPSIVSSRPLRPLPIHLLPAQPQLFPHRQPAHLPRLPQSLGRSTCARAAFAVRGRREDACSCFSRRS